MHKRSSIGKQNIEDADEVDFQVIPDAAKDIPSVQQYEKNPAAVALGRLGGKVGGRARAEKLSPDERSMIAKKAAQARWARSSDQGED